MSKINEGTAPVIKVDIEKVKALMQKGVDGVPELATYLKSLITENVQERVVAQLGEGATNNELEDIDKDTNADKEVEDDPRTKPFPIKKDEE